MAFLFKVQIKGITKPPVWRKILVPKHFSFLQFHEVIQEAFGWENYHLFQFSEKGFQSQTAIGIPDPENDWDEIMDAETVLLSEIFLKPNQKFTYIYDFGDNWTHEITLIEITDSNPLKPDCLEGKGTCPPEDCGGIWGYENLKEALKNPKHLEYKDMRRWLGLHKNDIWDENDFDLSIIKEALKAL